MKILFIASNRLKRVMPPMPLGLASIIATIDESRHEIRVLDLMFSEQPEAEMESVITDFSPDLIAMSIRNIDNQSYLHTEYLLPGIRILVQRCQNLSDATLVIGGPAFTVSPEEIFAYLGPDFGIAGEAEIVFPTLVDRIEGKADCADLPGLVWQGPDGVKMNPPEFIEDLDSLPIPRRDLFDNQRYAAERSIGNIVIKQGCSFRCLYCDSPHTMGSNWRKKSPEKVVDELEIMQKENGIQMAFFTDAIFNYPLDYAEAVCRAIIDRGVKMGWVTTLHPAHAKRDFIKLMRDAGCVTVSLASDSCSEKMLENLRKDITKADLRRTCELLEEMEINYILSLLIGGPGEDRATVDENIDFVRHRNPLFVDFCVGIRIMPHTALFDIAVEEGVIAPDDPLMEPQFYISPLIKDWIEDYLKEACAGHENWTIAHEG